MDTRRWSIGGLPAQGSQCAAAQSAHTVQGACADAVTRAIQLQSQLLSLVNGHGHGFLQSLLCLLSLALDTQHCNDHHNDHNRSGRQRDHEPCLPIEGLVLQVTVFQVQFRGRQDRVLGVHGKRNAVPIVGNHPECVRRRGHQNVIADRKVLHHALSCLLDFRPAGVVCD
ncbi:hypothetical protein M5D96_014086 [Drosophila gunungcola]|uniref:Uncharacterized protein n=1 Tax=Drosophila gunungcola TaxID=103775 RepID=A0A9Q0BIH3_9MUSC|nr:hypothetical protein M5D96_014086 [Drosophila gunungcola]